MRSWSGVVLRRGPWEKVGFYKAHVPLTELFITYKRCYKVLSYTYLATVTEKYVFNGGVVICFYFIVDLNLYLLLG